MRFPKVHGTIKRRLLVNFRVDPADFTDPMLFPRDSIAFDCALVMRDIPHEWASANEMYV